MHSTLRLARSPLLPFLALVFCVALAQPARANEPGTPVVASGTGGQFTSSALMRRPDVVNPAVSQARFNWEPQDPDRSGLPLDPASPDVSATPIGAATGMRVTHPSAVQAPQNLALTFNGASLVDTGAFPPDDMGAVGPSQFFVFVNGRLRTFDKTTGVADGVINANPDVFFASVMTPVTGSVLLNFTSDPQVRYDRLSGRWFLSIIDVPCTSSTCSTTAPNRWLLAVSDAASQGAITPSTVWTFYWFQGDASNFLDYPSLGVDAQALYVGGDMFTGAGSFVGCNAYVVNKSSVLAGGPVVVTAFANIVSGSGEGPFAPRGVDNLDPAANEGYFIGASNTAYGRLVLRRVSNPGGVPTISSNILLTVPTTTAPIPVQHLGNTGGNNGRLDALDDRLFAAHIRNGRLWTAHNIAVSATGVASTASTRRDGVRWYELNGVRSTDNAGVPVVVESGTLYDPAATLAAARQYWIPTVGVSGQGHVALGFSTAGTPYHADAATAGRLAGDALGTLQAPAIYTSSSTAYNPASDPGGSSGRRWGDYSFVSVDPLDDMTMWTIEQYCDASNSYGCRVARLMAPPPATPSSAPDALTGQVSIVVTLTGVQVAGSGFYDPGANLPGVPAFNHISAVLTNTGVTGTPPTVNSVTYVNPTTLQLDLNTTAATANLPGEKYGVRITNPDGQVVEGTGVIRVFDGATATELSMFTADAVDGGIELRWQFGSPGFASAVVVERALAGGVEWTRPAVALRSEGDVTVATDRTAEAGQSYQYRIVVTGRDGQSTTFGPVIGSLDAQAARTSLDGVTPNPTSGAVQIAFSLARPGPARVSVLDVQGRELTVLADGTRAAGRWFASWDGRTHDQRVEPGIYFVRYRTVNAVQTRRLVITR